MTRSLCSSLALLVGLVAFAQAARAQSSRDSALAAALLERLAVDQAIRDTLVQLLQSGIQPDSAFGARMLAIDSANTTWLKGVVTERGWPLQSQVGREASQAAFLIVQHAVHDTAFQAQALGLMEGAAAEGEASGSDVAMLADRIAVKRGELQRYGTQARIENGRVILEPIADSAGVDRRRAALGMPPLAEYVRVLDSLYTAQGARP